MCWEYPVRQRMSWHGARTFPLCGSAPGSWCRKTNSSTGSTGKWRERMLNRTGYYRMPHRIFGLGLTPIQFTVYSYLVSCTGQNTVCWPSYKTISIACGISRNAAIQAIDALIQKRLIDKIPTTRRNVQGRTRTSNNEYRIHDLSDLDPSA